MFTLSLLYKNHTKNRNSFPLIALKNVFRKDASLTTQHAIYMNQKDSIKPVFSHREKTMSNMLVNFKPFHEISHFEPLRNLEEFLNNYRLALPWNNWEA